MPCSAADSADRKGKTRVVPSAAADGRGKQCGGGYIEGGGQVVPGSAADNSDEQCGGGYIEGGGQVVPGSAADDGFPTSMFDEKGHR